jgi:hypothetical protein
LEIDEEVRMNTPRIHRRWHRPGGSDSVDAMRVAGLASIGAGLIHAAMISGHAEHPTVARLFVAVATAQLAAGLLTLVQGGRRIAAVLALVNGVAVGAWALTRTAGVSWIDGLEQAEAPQFIDTVCAGLGAVAVAGALGALWRRRDGTTRRLGVPGLAVAALAVAAMLHGATTVHSHGDHDAVRTDASAHDHGPVAAPEDASATGDHDDAVETTAEHTHGEQGSSPTPYDPTQPIDLSGIAGVTAEQQAFAENLVAVTVVRLPQWSDPAVAEAAGFHSIGDGITGHEHYVQWDWIEDDVWLDPDAPESLVYAVRPDGTKELVSAMYMLPGDMKLGDVPDYGGTLMQWHIHDDLCLTADPEAPVLGGLTNPDGTCPTPLVKPPRWPMIHVWITPTPCGPFAALEGIGAGQILPDEQRWCDHAHGTDGS